MSTVLVIEDDVTLQDLYKERFAASGVEILQAYDGKAGLDLLEKNPDIGAILIDLMIPKVSGFQVITRIRQNALNKDVPIVVASVLGDGDARQKSLDLGATDYIAKGDVLIGDLVTQVLRYVNAKEE